MDTSVKGSTPQSITKSTPKKLFVGIQDHLGADRAEGATASTLASPPDPGALVCCGKLTRKSRFGVKSIVLVHETAQKWPQGLLRLLPQTARQLDKPVVSHRVV
jgi:hypothetical protein